MWIHHDGELLALHLEIVRGVEEGLGGGLRPHHAEQVPLPVVGFEARDFRIERHPVPGERVEQEDRFGGVGT